MARGADAARDIARQTLRSLEEVILVADHALADELRATIFMMCRECPAYSEVVAQWESTHPALPIALNVWDILAIE